MKFFFSPLLLVIFGFINVTLCAESNSILDRLLSVFRPKVLNSGLPDFDSLIPTTSQYDNEIETLLGDIGDNVGYLRDVFQGESIEEYAKKLENDLLNGNLDKVTIKKLRKLCILGVRRNNGWFLKAAISFRQNLEKGRSLRDSWLSAASRSSRYTKLTYTVLLLCQTILLTQIDKFVKRLEGVVPFGYDLDKVNYLKSASLMPTITGKDFKIIFENWSLDLSKLWKSQPEARPAIKSHGKFWLRFVNFSEEIRQSYQILDPSPMDPIFEERDMTIKAFFESPIFEITKEEANDWSRI